MLRSLRRRASAWRRLESLFLQGTLRRSVTTLAHIHTAVSVGVEKLLENWVCSAASPCASYQRRQSQTLVAMLPAGLAESELECRDTMGRKRRKNRVASRRLRSSVSAIIHPRQSAPPATRPQLIGDLRLGWTPPEGIQRRAHTRPLL